MTRIEDLTLSILSKSTVVEDFKSEDSDLNDFLLSEAKDYQEQLMAVTYILKDNSANRIVAYFSLLNDTIRFEKNDKKTRNKINRKIPYTKQRNHYPAVKIGRLAVDTDYSGQGIGEHVLRFIKTFFTVSNKTGCRFITVDAYAKSVGFYEEKGGFKFFTDSDECEETRLMYFDLKPFKNALSEI